MRRAQCLCLLQRLPAAGYRNCNGSVYNVGSNGNTVMFYDVNGCILATKRGEYAPLRFDAPVSGTYMIKIGNHPARKVVVVR